MESSAAPAPPTGKNILQRGAEFVAAHSTGAFAVIIILTILCVVLGSIMYARIPDERKNKQKNLKSKDDDEDANDPEISRLVNSINNAR